MEEDYDFLLDEHKIKSLDVRNYSNTRFLSVDHEIEEAKASLEEDYDFLLDEHKIESLDVRNYSTAEILFFGQFRSQMKFNKFFKENVFLILKKIIIIIKKYE